MPLSQTRKIIIGTIIGVSAFCALFLWQGVEAVGTLLGQGGLPLLFVCLFAPVEQWLASEGWRVLFPRGRRPQKYARYWHHGWGRRSIRPPRGDDRRRTREDANPHSNGQPTGPTVAIMFVDKTAQALAVEVRRVRCPDACGQRGDIAVASSAFQRAFSCWESLFLPFFRNREC